MSWSAQAIGKVEAVQREIDKQFAQSKCMEPEESVRQAAKLVIDAALAAQKPGTAVKVAASGSQNTQYDGQGKPTGVTNYLSIAVEPQYGWVE